MKWSSMGLFPTPLIKIDIEDTRRAHDFFFNEVYPQQSLNEVLTHFHSTENVFSIYPQLQWLQLKLQQAGTFAYQELLNYQRSGPMVITNAWFNLCEVGGSQIKHGHANSLLSATLYLHADEQTEIEFYHPLSTSSSLYPELFDEPEKRQNQYGMTFHNRKVTVSVSSGECLFWPSQLQHGYSNNKTPKRLTLSFNMMPKQFNSVYQLTS